MVENTSCKPLQAIAESFNDHVWKDVVTDEGIRVHRTFQRPVSLGPAPALLAVDLYNLVYRGGPHPPHELTDENPSACGIYAWQAISPTIRLFESARRAGIPVIYTTALPKVGGFHSANRPTNRQVAGLRLEPDDYEIRNDFRPSPDDIIICKERASGFFGTPLISHLTRLGVKSLIVCGESTSGCVRASVIDAYSYGFNTVVVEECTFDRYELTHKINLFDMHHKYAGVMHVDEVIASLDGQRRSSQSKDSKRLATQGRRGFARREKR